jgi:hypothetical protein
LDNQDAQSPLAYRMNSFQPRNPFGVRRSGINVRSC